MAVRSNYIKSLMDSKKSFEKQYEEVLKESMKNIIGDNAKEEVRKLLKESEDEDSFTEEEVIDDTATTDKEDSDNVDDAATDGDDTDGDDTLDVDGTEGTDDLDTSDDEDLWNDLEDCKTADGEYDCRGLEDDKMLKVVKAMGPEDGIRVMQNNDGTIEDYWKFVREEPRIVQI